MTPSRPNYFAVFATFASNSLVRDMMFRANFIVECISAIVWSAVNFCFYLLVLNYATQIGSGWTRFPFFVFLATGMIVNSLLQTFFLANAERFSELIRKGDLDFILLKPIDTQFAISFERIKWSGLATFVVGMTLLAYSLVNLDYTPGPWQVVLYVVYVLCGAAILYSLIISLAAASVWMGRNQSLYDFWFYITIFSRYPMEIYEGRLGTPLRVGFSFVIPILLTINIPARFMAKPLQEGEGALAAYTLGAAILCVLLSRSIFGAALRGYRSASS